MLKHTLVLGASLKPNRYSHIAIKRLRSYNHPVTAVGLMEGTVGDIDIITFESAFAKFTLSEVEGAETSQESVHTVTLYLNPKRQSQYYDYILSLKPNRVIFNPGTENPEFYALLKEKAINYEVACTLVLLATNQY
ncbi:CoA-binding protein [Dokdonia sinensis]|uniref:CoA-binding protein n=1 Tax=Dokdonia sinensis TaxID=2479847 RepID=A0A3M0GH76_9FLAO|nr:CoA-binding protein [Dokdonia sinensis]RMB64020.1 CoA-binding protein [Dokdonia sinensis]